MIFAADVVLDAGQKLTNLVSGNFQLNYVSGNAGFTTRINITVTPITPT